MSHRFVVGEPIGHVHRGAGHGRPRRPRPDRLGIRDGQQPLCDSHQVETSLYLVHLVGALAESRGQGGDFRLPAATSPVSSRRRGPALRCR